MAIEIYKYYNGLHKSLLFLYKCLLVLLSCFLGCRFLCLWFGSFLSLWFLGSLLWLLSSWLFCLLCLLGLLCLWLLWFLCLLDLGCLSRQFERSSTLFTCCSSRNNLLGSNHLLKSKTDTDSSLGCIHFVVSNNILENGLTGGSFLVTKSLDSSSYH